MPTIETVEIGKVLPLYDEYGNCLARRDYDLPENREYVEELARSMSPKGVPDEMVTLVRDGDMFRIKAGNSRIEAMRILGTETFEAIVEDADESKERAIVETTLRTNVKKKYEPVEESRFVQQLLLFASDADVSEVTGMDVPQVAAVRRASKAVGAPAETMSLMRLLAIDEFEGDEDAVEELTACGEAQWEQLAGKHRYAKRMREQAESFLAECERRAIPVVTAREDIPEGLTYETCACDCKLFASDIPDGSVIYDDACGPYRFNLYIPAVEGVEEKTPEEIAQEKRLAQVERAQEGFRRSARRWLADKLASGIIPPWIALAVESDKDRFFGEVSRFMDDLEDDAPLDLRCTTIEAIKHLESRLRRSCLIYRHNNHVNAEEFFDLLAKLSDNGFSIDDDCRVLVDLGDELVAAHEEEIAGADEGDS